MDMATQYTSPITSDAEVLGEVNYRLGLSYLLLVSATIRELQLHNFSSK